MYTVSALYQCILYCCRLYRTTSCISWKSNNLWPPKTSKNYYKYGFVAKVSNVGVCVPAMARGNIITTFSGSQHTHTGTMVWLLSVDVSAFVEKNQFFGESVTRRLWWRWCTSTTTPHHIECATLIFSPETHLTLHFTADKVIWINSLQWINSKFDEHLLLRRQWVSGSTMRVQIYKVNKPTKSAPPI